MAFSFPLVVIYCIMRDDDSIDVIISVFLFRNIYHKTTNSIHMEAKRKQHTLRLRMLQQEDLEILP